MSLRHVDPRFCLPEAPRSAVVLGELGPWEEGLAQAGVEIRSSGLVDLAVAPAAAAAEALASGAPTIILEGRGGSRILRAAGKHPRSFLVRPRADAPELLLPRNERHPAAYAIRYWSAGYTRRKRLRNRLAAMVVSRPPLPEIEPVVALGTSSNDRPPWIVAAAEPFGVSHDVGYFLSCGQGDVLSRNVFHLFRPRDVDPTWALKFARVAGYEEPFARDEAGLALAAAAGRAVSQRVPHLVGRFAVGGIEASLETAAVGEKLRATLLAPGSADRKLQRVHEVAAWLLTVGRETAAPAGALAPELERLKRDVLPAWRDFGVEEELVDTLPPLPAVLQHNDMGCWNVVAGPDGFTVVDWESARGHGLPLWDLTYFLVDALVTMDGPLAPGEHTERSLELLRGELPASAVLFDHVARMARELGIRAASVGPVVTLGWLHHGLSHRKRASAVDRAGAGGPPGLPGPLGRLAKSWLEDPALGTEWKAWRGA